MSNGLGEFKVHRILHACRYGPARWYWGMNLSPYGFADRGSENSYEHTDSCHGYPNKALPKMLIFGSRRCCRPRVCLDGQNIHVF